MSKNEKKVSLSCKGLKPRYCVGEECVFYLQSIVSKVVEKKVRKKSISRVFSVALDCSSSMSRSAGALDGCGLFEQLIDNSSSSQKRSSRLDECKNALNEMIDSLEEHDWLSLVLFSTQSHVAFPKSLMTIENKERIKEIIKGLTPSGSTALFEGWLEAAQQASSGLADGLPSRIVLLTDGEATTENNIDKISSAVENMKNFGVSTSCFGVGVGFNEDLLIAMSRKGDGNFRYIPDALMAKRAAIDELSDFSKTIGTNVVLEIEGNIGYEIVGIDETSSGRFELSNLISGNSSGYILKTQKTKDENDVVLNVKLSWVNKDGLKEEEFLKIEQKIEQTIVESVAKDEQVQCRYLGALANDKRRQITQSVNCGNWELAGKHLADAQSLVSAMSQDSELYNNEMKDLNKLGGYIVNKQDNLLKKESVWQTYSRTLNQSVQEGANLKTDSGNQ